MLLSDRIVQRCLAFVAIALLLLGSGKTMAVSSPLFTDLLAIITPVFYDTTGIYYLPDEQVLARYDFATKKKHILHDDVSDFLVYENQLVVSVKNRVYFFPDRLIFDAGPKHQNLSLLLVEGVLLIAKRDPFRKNCPAMTAIDMRSQQVLWSKEECRGSLWTVTGSGYGISSMFSLNGLVRDELELRTGKLICSTSLGQGKCPPKEDPANRHTNCVWLAVPESMEREETIQLAYQCGPIMVMLESPFDGGDRILFYQRK